MLVCGLIIFELAAIIVLLAVSGRKSARRHDEIEERWVLLFGWLDRTSRRSDEFKKDFDTKFGPDLVKRLNAIFKLGVQPSGLMVKDGKVVKINRDY
jgi:hypothetical protein